MGFCRRLGFINPSKEHSSGTALTWGLSVRWRTLRSREMTSSQIPWDGLYHAVFSLWLSTFFSQFFSTFLSAFIVRYVYPTKNRFLFDLVSEKVICLHWNVQSSEFAAGNCYCIHLQILTAHINTHQEPQKYYRWIIRSKNHFVNNSVGMLQKEIILRTWEGLRCVISCCVQRDILLLLSSTTPAHSLLLCIQVLL